MLCDICLHVVSEIVTLQEAKRLENIRKPVQDVIPILPTSQSKEQRVQQCYICGQMECPIEDVGIKFDKENQPWKRDIKFRLGRVKQMEHCNWLERTLYIQSVDKTIYDMAKRSSLSPSTGSEQSLKLVSHWFTDCLQNHQKCRAKQNERWYPARLLDVSTDEIRLVRTLDHTLNEPYVTMSHCWGTERFLVLTAENMPEFEAGINLTRLPNNFRDAIAVIRTLELRYIWIDCYCIVQDSMSDGHKAEKLLDIAQMKQVYANSILNVAASHASNPKDGCFIDRTKFDNLPQCFFRRQSDGEPSDDYFHLYYFEDAQQYVATLSSHRIFDRAWVLQERLLCTRIVHFGSDQIYWECQELLPACEAYPCGQEIQPSMTVFSTEDQDLTHSARYTWCRTVQDYTAMQLTYPTEDKFVAIGGIAEHIVQYTNDEYVAGLFKEDFILQLCWQPSYPSRRASQWRAPSWSWASIDNTVFLDAHLLADSIYIAMVSIQKTHIELTDPNNIYGPLRSASLVLTGRLVKVSRLPDSKLPTTQLAPRSWIPVQLDSSEYFLKAHPDDTLSAHLLSANMYILPICMAFFSPENLMQIEAAIAYPQEVQQYATIHGLLVEKVAPDEFVRRGCISSCVVKDECLNYAAFLKMWTSTSDETITLL